MKFKELHAIVKDDFFNRPVDQIKENFRPFNGIPIKYSELSKYIDIRLTIK